MSRPPSPVLRPPSPGNGTPSLTVGAGWIAVLWLVVYAFAGRLSDDGLHAYAARAILHGHRLYADFEYHQAPLLPHLLALWFRLFGVGMLQARLFAALVGGVALWLAVRLARRLGAGEAGLGLAVAAVALSPSLMLHLGYVQSQGLATALALGAVLAALAPGTAGPLAAWALAALAAGARVSFVALALPLAWYAWRTRRALLLPGLALWAAVLAAVFLPFVRGGGIADMLYLPFAPAGNLLTQHHLGLYVVAPAGPLAGLLKRVSSWPNQLIYYAPLWLLSAVVWPHRPRGDEHRLALGVALLLTLVHGVLPQRVNHSYLVVAMPFWAALAAAWWPAARRPWWLWALAVVAAALGVGRGVSRLDLAEGRPMLARLNEAAGRVADLTPRDGQVFTFAIEVAVAADRDVTPGLEAGYFSYFVNMDDVTARRCHVLNHDLALDLLRRRVPETLLMHAGAFQPVERTHYRWPAGDDLWAAVADGYDAVESWRHVGEKAGPAVLWRRKDARLLNH